MQPDLARREATLTLPVRLLSRLVGRDEAHSSKNDEMRARPDFERWFKESNSWTGGDYLWLNRFRDLYLDTELARPARALTPGSPGVVQKGERT